MATVQNWNPVAGIRMPDADPTRALAAASASFGNIGDAIRQQRESESLAAMNAEKMDLARREQDWQEGTLERALAEDQAIYDRGIQRNQEKAKTLEDVYANAGGSRFEEIQKGLNYDEMFKNDAAYQAMSPEERQTARTYLEDQLRTRKDLTSDIGRARPNLSQALRMTGQYDEDQIDNLTEKGLERIFRGRLPSAAEYNAMGITPGGSGKVSDSTKFVQDILMSQFETSQNRNSPESQIKEAESLRKWKEATVPKEQRSKLFGLIPIPDIMSQRVYGEHVDTALARAAKQNISQGAMLKALDTVITDEHSGAINIKDLKDNDPIFDVARTFDQQQAGGTGGLDLPTMLGIAQQMGGAGGGGGQMTTQQAMQAMDHSNATPEQINKFVMQTFSDKWGSAKVPAGQVNPNTGMPNPENVEEAQVQEQLLTGAKGAGSESAPVTGELPELSKILLPESQGPTRHRDQQASRAIQEAAEQVKNIVLPKLKYEQTIDYAEANFLRSSPVWDDFDKFQKKKLEDVLRRGPDAG